MNKRVEAIRAQKYPVHVWDALVLAVIAVLTVVLILSVNREKGNSVEIAYSGKTIVLALEKDTERRVGDHLTVVIEDGACYVKDADCDKKTCVKTGKIRRVGETIVCAQNGIVITVTGNDGLVGTVGQG